MGSEIQAVLEAEGIEVLHDTALNDDPAYSGADSIQLLKQVCSALQKNGYKIGNIDSTVIAQQPKLKPYIDQMRNTLADACGVSAGQVSVKATTEEKLGFTGNGQGISAHAVCLIENI